MSEVLTVARAKVGILQRDRAVELYREAFPEGEIGKVAKSITLWESGSEPGGFLVVARYSDEAAADRGLEIVSESEAFASLIQIMDTPPDIRRYRVAGERGLSEAEAGEGSCLSLSVRSSDPGLGWDLDAELARILDEISMLPGYLGSIHGRSATVHEEVMSIALWQDENSYRASVPSHKLFLLSSYIKVA